MANMAEQLKRIAEEEQKTIIKESALDVERFYDEFLINDLKHKALQGECSFVFPHDLSQTAKEHLGSIVESPSVGTYFEFALDSAWDYTFILYRHLENKLKSEGFKPVLNAEKTPYIQIMW